MSKNKKQAKRGFVYDFLWFSNNFPWFPMLSYDSRSFRLEIIKIGDFWLDHSKFEQLVIAKTKNPRFGKCAGPSGAYAPCCFYKFQLCIISGFHSVSMESESEFQVWTKCDIKSLPLQLEKITNTENTRSFSTSSVSGSEMGLPLNLQTVCESRKCMATAKTSTLAIFFRKESKKCTQHGNPKCMPNQNKRKTSTPSVPSLCFQVPLDGPIAPRMPKWRHHWWRPQGVLGRGMPRFENAKPGLRILVCISYPVGVS